MTKKEKLPPQIYYQQLPKRYTSAGGLIFNERNELLIVEPSYKERWDIPGGVSEAGETLLDTVLREVHEELGIKVEARSLLCIDLKPGREPVPDSIQSIFEIVPLSAQQLADIRVDGDEIIDYGFFPVEEALPRLDAIAPRVRMAIEARENRTVYYLEDGRKVI